jgi:hypothetical protein
MTHMPIDRVEVPIGLIAQLSYYQESKNTNFLEKNTKLFISAARKTISQMLMNDVQVNTPACDFPIQNISFSYVNSTRMYSMEQMKVNLFYAIHFSPLQI